MMPRETSVLPSIAALPVILALSLSCTSTSEKLRSTSGKIPDHTIVHEDAKQTRKALADIIEKVRAKYQIEGISLVLVRNQDTLWLEGFGYADRERLVPVTPGTVFRAGSLAKPFTATAVMQLEEQGRLDIDQPINAYVPQFSIRSRFDTTAAPITVRSILCHHSGLPTDLNKGMWSNDPFTKVAAQLNEEYTAFPPNLVFSYSNLGYTLLGHMIQEVSGEDYSAYMRSHLFEPMGMHRSGMRLRPDMAAHLSKGYREGMESDLLPIRDLPAYSLYTTAEDLGRFMKTILSRGSINGKQVLMPETLEEMLEPQNSDVPLDLNIINGIGWFLEKNSIPEGGPVFRHGGTTLVYSSELIVLPEKGLGVAVLANSSGSRSLVSQLAEEILKRILDRGQQAESMQVALQAFSREVSDPLPSAPGGTYATDLGLISIRPKDAKLCACIIEKTFDLIPYPNGWFGINENSVDSLPPSYEVFRDLRFKTLVIDGVEVIVAEQGEKRVVLGEKIPPIPIPEAWLQRVGTYRLINPDDAFPLTEPKVLVDQGQLCMSYKMPLLSNKTIRVPLRPISDTEAVILGLGRARGETLRAINVDGEERLRYSGFVGKKLRRY